MAVRVEDLVFLTGKDTKYKLINYYIFELFFFNEQIILWFIDKYCFKFIVFYMLLMYSILIIYGDVAFHKKSCLLIRLALS